MTGTYTDIQTLARNLNAKGYELDKVRDPNHKQANQPPQHPAGHGGSGSKEQDSMWAWQQAHPNNAPGQIEVQILAERGKGQASPWLDPGSVNADSPAIVDYMAKHPSQQV